MNVQNVNIYIDVYKRQKLRRYKMLVNTIKENLCVNKLVASKKEIVFVAVSYTHLRFNE